MSAADYIYDYTLIVYVSRYDTSGKIGMEIANEEFNVAGYGTPTFSFDTQNLVVTNAGFPASGVTAVVTSIQLGGWPTYPLL